ncbi:oxidoreductase [Gordonia soli]|uniref:Putative oxidoreductase n=1 Tax=Gordonia soli NBRC 108243 TaxID=1223545 RepID=M0QGA1_9ACTN|nr:oxidoreductase [Gordonia soli]GAC67474.1 putative oxidoreductase [Gordonia soli NBRC 108243]
MAAPGWTLTDAPAQHGRTAVVTGANTGLGLETAHGLARLGASVVLACRNVDAAKTAREQILADLPEAQIDIVELDLSSLESVRTAADELNGRDGTIDLVVANAGVMASRHTLTADGFELDFGTNFLGHHAFIGLLMPRVLDVAGRVVTVGSTAGRAGVIDFDDLPFEHRFSGARAYSRAKFAQMVFAVELQRRLEAAGASALSVAAHPGATRTGVMREQTPFLRWAFTSPRMRWLLDLFVMDVADGALPTLRAATDPDVLGGEYFGPSGPLQFTGSPRRVDVSDKVLDPQLGQRLWTTAEELTRVVYPFGSRG